LDTIILSDWLSARLDRAHAEPMYRQVLDLMQQAILTGQLAPGTKLPSSRTLAADLEIARNTVLHVYDQLTAEGYVISSTGSGTYVADTRPQADNVEGRRAREVNAQRALQEGMVPIVESMLPKLLIAIATSWRATPGEATDSVKAIALLPIAAATSRAGVGSAPSPAIEQPTSATTTLAP